ncbi:MAG TPA: hypothetical protein VJV74_07435 [Terriglobia bacterium]|nr:hypothetical protein [Terriglobia bacterium]
MTTWKRFVLPVVLAFGIAVTVGLAQDHTAGQGPDSPPKADTARFGDPTSTGRNLQGYVYGVIKKIGHDELILDKTEYGDGQSFKLQPKTKYVRDGKPGKLADLKAGQGVFIDVKKEKKTGDLIAKKVVLGLDPAQSR